MALIQYTPCLLKKFTPLTNNTGPCPVVLPGGARKRNVSSENCRLFRSVNIRDSEPVDHSGSSRRDEWK